MAPIIITAKHIPSIANLYVRSLLKASTAMPKRSPSVEANATVGLYRGDITKLEVDAIVNAANNSLLGGGGVDGAIHRGAGPELVAECRTLGGCPTGEARITQGYELPAKHVIHTVGPIYDSPEVSSKFLRGCYKNSLQVALENNLVSIAFSGISTGVYGYPSEDAAQIACETVREFVDENKGKIEQIIFVTFEEKDVAAYNDMIP
ncbi:hypothetical protein VHEMI06221 [[Torrubiella] hemipterigena]|uniref:Macro domain-containing protein n=1 Tax=[Torrubiella] hemipterigena TaxID=1531966 RepID=A0A0A1TIW2_9HYPO|nr:hypothetical protein VHEMI06221 [[Torrubiella] hemipterigena]